MSANTAEQDHDLLDDVEDTDEVTDAKVNIDSDTDNVGDASVEINVEELISELEADGLVEACSNEHAAKKRRLDELMDLRRSRKDLEDFDDYDL